ncbi:MAG TPA: hypothetical protein VFR85_15120 [Anaeromyxobacteraceae bacterium]|nr:hypothetical protein [Anaeromyxobacteraceae bacterium]
MPDQPKAPSALALWLEDALKSRILQVTAIAVAAAVAALYLAGYISEPATGAFAAVGAPLAGAALAARPALAGGRDPRGRALAALAAAAAFFLSAGPSLTTIVPGEPLLAGELSTQGQTLPVPPEAAGRVRVLVSGRLGADPEVSFRVSGTVPALDGRLERSWSTARVGRGGRARVAHDHLADWYEAAIPPGVAALKLERLQGRPGSALALAIHREWMPRWLLLSAMALALAASAAADARLGTRNDVAVPVAMVLAFGLLVDHNATPLAAVGPAMGGVLLGAMLGALAGALASFVARRLLPAGRRPGKRG